MGAPMGRGYAYGVSTVPGYDQPASGRLSVAQVAVIAHEVGHAQQHAKKDPLMSLRMAVVPVAQIGSTFAPWLVIIGVFMRLTGLAVAGLAFFAGAVAFTFITLPVEFGASNSALAFVGPLGPYRRACRRCGRPSRSRLDLRGRGADRAADVPLLPAPWCPRTSHAARQTQLQQGHGPL